MNLHHTSENWMEAQFRLRIFSPDEWYHKVDFLALLLSVSVKITRPPPFPKKELSNGFCRGNNYKPGVKGEKFEDEKIKKFQTFVS